MSRLLDDYWRTTARGAHAVEGDDNYAHGIDLLGAMAVMKKKPAAKMTTKGPVPVSTRTISAKKPSGPPALVAPRPVMKTPAGVSAKGKETKARLQKSAQRLSAASAKLMRRRPRSGARLRIIADKLSKKATTIVGAEMMAVMPTLTPELYAQFAAVASLAGNIEGLVDLQINILNAIDMLKAVGQTTVAQAGDAIAADIEKIYYAFDPDNPDPSFVGQLSAIEQRAGAWQAAAQTALSSGGVVPGVPASGPGSFDPGTPGDGGAPSGGEGGEAGASEGGGEDEGWEEGGLTSDDEAVQRFRESGGEWDPFAEESSEQGEGEEGYYEEVPQYEEAAAPPTEEEEFWEEPSDAEMASTLDEENFEDNELNAIERVRVRNAGLDELSGISTSDYHFEVMDLFTPHTAFQRTFKEAEEKAVAQSAAGRGFDPSEAPTISTATQGTPSPAVAAKLRATQQKLAALKAKEAQINARRLRATQARAEAATAAAVAAEMVAPPLESEVMGDNFDPFDDDLNTRGWQKQITDAPADPIRRRASVHRGDAYLQDATYPPWGSSHGEEGGAMIPEEVVEVLGHLARRESMSLNDDIEVMGDDEDEMLAGLAYQARVGGPRMRYETPEQRELRLAAEEQAAADAAAAAMAAAEEQAAADAAAAAMAAAEEQAAADAAAAAMAAAEAAAAEGHNVAAQKQRANEAAAAAVAAHRNVAAQQNVAARRQRFFRRPGTAAAAAATAERQNVAARKHMTYQKPVLIRGDEDHGSYSHGTDVLGAIATTGKQTAKQTATLKTTAANVTRQLTARGVSPKAATAGGKAAAGLPVRAGFVQRTTPAGRKYTSLVVNKVKNSKQIIANAKDAGKRAISVGKKLENALKKGKIKPKTGVHGAAPLRRPSPAARRAGAHRGPKLSPAQVKKVAQEAIKAGTAVLKKADSHSAFVTSFDNKVKAGNAAARVGMKPRVGGTSVRGEEILGIAAAVCGAEFDVRARGIANELLEDIQIFGQDEALPDDSWMEEPGADTGADAGGGYAGVPGPPDYGMEPPPTPESVRPVEGVDYMKEPEGGNQITYNFADWAGQPNNLPHGAIPYDFSRKPPFKGICSFNTFYPNQYSGNAEGGKDAQGVGAGFEWHGDEGSKWWVYWPSSGGVPNPSPVNPPSEEEGKNLDVMFEKSLGHKWGPLIGNPNMADWAGLRFLKGAPEGSPQWFWFYNTAPAWAKGPGEFKRLNDATVDYQARLTAAKADYAAQQLQDQLDAQAAEQERKAQALEDAATARRQGQEQTETQHQAALQAVADAQAAEQQRLADETASRQEAAQAELESRMYREQGLAEQEVWQRQQMTQAQIDRQAMEAEQAMEEKAFETELRLAAMMDQSPGEAVYDEAYSQEQPVDEEGLPVEEQGFVTDAEAPFLEEDVLGMFRGIHGHKLRRALRE